MNDDLTRRRSEDFKFMVLCASKQNMGMYQLLRDRSIDLDERKIEAELRLIEKD